MTLRLANVTFDCNDAARVATFWSAALDRPIDEDPSAWFASIGRGDHSQTVWLFIKVPEGKQGKNRVHVDLHAEDRAAEVERLVALGAQRHSDHAEHGLQWTTLLDVEGNEFCVA
ncbi:MAG: VOC family protein [Chloroflexota bacterium]|nr:VOC family protein [Chloroflexota bacterium]